MSSVPMLIGALPAAAASPWLWLAAAAVCAGASMWGFWRWTADQRRAVAYAWCMIATVVGCAGPAFTGDTAYERTLGHIGIACAFFAGKLYGRLVNERHECDSHGERAEDGAGERAFASPCGETLE